MEEENLNNQETAQLGIGVDMLCTSKKISNDSKIDIFKALTKMESEGKCTMGDLPDDVY